TWRGFSAAAYYEYVVPVSASEDEIFARFESETRTKVRRAQKHEGLEVRDGGLDDLLRLREMLRERYAAQGIRWGVSEAYVRDVFQAFAPAELGVKVAVHEGEIVTGMVTLYYGDVAQDWIGGFAPARPLSGVNELLHWVLVQEARARGAAGYDLGGANTEHLALTKSKYNPDLLPHFHVEKAGQAARTMKPVLTTRVGRALYARLR
ncbi:MAG TPA: GNAT family N-acetyltransferase, partial [Longimicrobium sp.]|nr:GNAT family N-acetyltransferase [Longimicrobium sp.]